MRAVRIHNFGGPHELVYEEVPQPRTAADEVLVRVHAAGVNPIDWIARQEGDFGFGRIPLPWIPGWDVSGTVEAVEAAQSTFTPGDSVFGLVRMPASGNAYAEYAAVPAGELATKPAALDHIAAAGVPMAALTAWRALFDEAGIEAGRRVLVHAAAGGVGHLAVQLARWAGARVVGTASGDNEDYVRGLGADEVVDYRAQPFEHATGAVDAVIDTVGGEVLRRSAGLLRKGGVLVTLPEDPGEDRVEEFVAEHGVRLRWFSVEPDAEALAEIASLIDSGTLRPTISGVRPLAQAKAAHIDSEAGHVRGKLVLDTLA